MMDTNLRLACAQQLQLQGILPSFQKEEWYKTEQGIDYSDTEPYNYDAQQSIIAWYESLGVEDHLKHITTLTWSPESGPIQDIWTYWDGEDNTFTIRNLDGIQACTQLESIRIQSLLKCDDLTPLTQLPALKKVHCIDVLITSSDVNKQIVKELQQRGVEVIITTAQQGHLTVESQTGGSQQVEAGTAEPLTIPIAPIAPEQCIEILNGLFPRFVGVLNNTLHIDTEKMKTTQFTMPMSGNPRSTVEPPDKTTIEAHYNENDGTVQYHCFGSIVKMKDAISAISNIRAMVQLIPNETDLIEIVIVAQNAINLPHIETIHLSTTMLTADQKAAVEKILVDALT